MSTNFTIRRPTPVSNDSSDVESTPTFKVPALPSHLRNSHKAATSSLLNPNGKRRVAFGDSDDEGDDAATDELVIGFDAMGAQRAQDVAAKSEPLIIPAIPNKDWRAAARQRKGYRPDEGKIKVGVDGSQGGMGTKDTINSGPQQSGLIVYKKRKIEEDSDGDLKMEAKEEKDVPQKAEDEAMTDEQRAVNALLIAAKQASEGAPMEEIPLEAIPMTDSVDWRQPKSETDAYREDVATRPDSASLEDYQRVPVSQFGTALLMGMGWKPGQGASKSGKGPVEAHAPKARPALLGLGAKPTDVAEGSQSQRSNAKPSKKYVPVVAKEREKNGESSRNDSRQSERDIDARESRDRRDYSKSRDRSRERGGGQDRSRSKERRDRRDDDRDRNRHHEYDRRGERPRSKRRDDGREPERPGEGRRGGTREDKYRDGDRRDRDESKKRR